MGRFVRVCIAGLTLLLTVAIAAAVGVVILVAQGPVSLAPVTPYLEDALANSVAPYQVRIEDTILSWDSEADRVDLRAVDVRLTAGNDGEVLSIPQMSVTLSAGEAMRGRAVITKASLIRARLSLLRDADGGWFLVQPESGNRSPLSLRNDGTVKEAISFGQLRHLAVVDATVTLTDASSAVSVEARSATGELTLDDDRLVGRATARLLFADSEAAVGLGVEYQDGGDGLRAALNVADLDVASLGRLLQHSELRELARFDATMSGRIDISASADGSAPRLALDLATGPGTFSVPELFDAPLKLNRFTLKGDGSAAGRAANIEEAAIELVDGPTLAFSGRLGYEADGPEIAGQATATPFATTVLRSHWPEGFASGARQWVMKNIKRGTISDLSLNLDLPPQAFNGGDLADDAILLRWKFADVTSTYLGDLPPLRSGRGHGRVSATRFDLQVDAAEVEGGLSVSDGKLAVADFNAEVAVLEIDFVTRGDAKAVLALLDRPPLGLPGKIGLRPQAVSGQSATATRLTIPLLDDITLDEVGYSAATTLTNVNLPNVWRDWGLENGALTLRASAQGLHLSGTADVNGIPLELEWQRPIDSSSAPGRLQVRGSADVGQLTGLGFDASAYGTGELGVALDLFLSGDDISGQVALDLAATTVALPALAWSKPAGMPASARFQLHLMADGGVDIGQLALAAPAFELQGDLRFDAAGRLSALTAPSVFLNGSRLRLDVMQAGDAVYDVRLAGERLDLRPFEPDMGAVGGAQEPWPAAVRLNANLAEVVVTDELLLKGVSGDAFRSRLRWQRADISGQLPGEAAARLVVQGTDDGYDLNFASNDAGAAARAFGIYDHAIGGRMYLKGRIVPHQGAEPEISGVLRADDFVLENAPLLARVLTLGSLRGINDAFSGNGIAFTRLELPFVMQGDRIDVDKGRAVGPALGLTGNLTIDNASDTIEASGTLVPAYTINSVLGNIPIIGEILVGRAGEGVFALTFQIDGPTEDPRITVNPLSALAPGFLRRILEGLEQPTRALDSDLQPADSGGQRP